MENFKNTKQTMPILLTRIAMALEQIAYKDSPKQRPLMAEELAARWASFQHQIISSNPALAEIRKMNIKFFNNEICFEPLNELQVKFLAGNYLYIYEEACKHYDNTSLLITGCNNA